MILLHNPNVFVEKSCERLIKTDKILLRIFILFLEIKRCIYKMY
jgi:hypothetical protein